jgi:ABC-type polysaccharide/polyol phosphate export permease
MVAYLGQVWRCWHFWLSLVKQDLCSRYRRSLLGLGWSLLPLLVMTALLCGVFHGVFQTDVRHYAPFLLAGLSCWSFLCTAILQGCQALFLGEAYIRQSPLPVAIFPLRTVLGAAVHFLLALLAAVLLAWCANGPGNLPALAALPVGVVLLFVFGWSVATLVAFANVYLRDTRHLCEVGLQFAYFVTPVLYEPKFLLGSGLYWVARVNPFGPFLELIRDPIVYGRVSGPGTFALAAGIAALAAGAATLTLARLQRAFIFRM